MKHQKQNQEPLSPDAILSMSKIWQQPIYRQKGLFQGELTKMMLDKLGIHEDELKKLDERAIKHNREAADEYVARIEKAKIDPELLIRRLRATAGTNGPTLMDWTDVESTTIPVVGNPFRNDHLHNENPPTAFYLEASTDKSITFPAFDFKFLPWINAPYRFELPFFITFPYFLAADDGPFTDRYAEFGVVIEITMQQESLTFMDNVPFRQMEKVQGGTYLGVIYKCVTNEAISDHCLFGDVIQFGAPWLQNGLPVIVSVVVRIVSVVKGNGSIVDINLSQGTGAVISDSLRVIRRSYN